MGSSDSLQCYSAALATLGPVLNLGSHVARPGHLYRVQTVGVRVEPGVSRYEIAGLGTLFYLFVGTMPSALDDIALPGRRSVGIGALF